MQVVKKIFNLMRRRACSTVGFARKKILFIAGVSIKIIKLIIDIKKNPRKYNGDK